MSRKVSPHVARALKGRGKASSKPSTDIETVENLAYKALANGAERIGQRLIKWDVSGTCQTPVKVVRWSRATGDYRRVNRDGVASRPMIEVTMLTKCRKCAECRRKRAALWRFRAIAEIKRAERTWFGTLTASPDEHVRMELRARARLANNANATEKALFSALAQEMGIEATKWLKRVRERASVPFRYLLVAEVHNSVNTSEEMRGRPHLHILIHDYAGQPLRKHHLKDAWKIGHCKFTLLSGDQSDFRGAMYLTKYITKTAELRIRASLNYGEENDALGSIDTYKHSTE